MLQAVVKRLAFNVWANNRVVLALSACALDRAIALMGHVVATESVYLERIRGLDPWPQEFWPELDLDSISSLVLSNEAAYAQYLASMSSDSLLSSVAYRTSRSEVCSNTASDLLEQVLSHGVYHRGQINLLLRQAGSAPPSPDFIVFSRALKQ